MSSALKKLEEIVSDLPADAQAEVIDFAEFLREKKRREQVKASPKARVAGLNQGEIWMSDDFNDELPDEFWFGEDFGIIENKNESVD